LIDAVENGRVQRTKPVSDFVVATVHRERVLHQIIGAKFEEVDDARNLVKP